MKKLRLVAFLLVVIMVLPFTFAACKPTGPQSGEYTYRMATSSITTNWNTHTYSSNDATDVLTYTEDSLYTFDYNDKKDNYVIVPSMAKEMPVDVSSDYATQFGYKDTEEGRAYKIQLRNNLKFQNGDPITAQTFVDSVKLLLNPAAANMRASDTYSGNMVIYGAEAYSKQGLTSEELVSAIYETVQKAWADDYKIYLDINAINVTFAELFGADYEAMKKAGDLDKYFSIYENGEKTDTNFFEKYDVEKAKDNKIEVTQAMLDDYAKCTDVEPNAQTDVAALSSVTYTYPSYDFEDVGVFVDPQDEYSLIVVLEKSLTGFYLNYSLSSSFWLVHPETYERCTKNVGGVYSNDYGTSKDKYVGFGPYQIETYTADHSVTFERNTNWWGYSDANESKYYQTTHITLTKVTEQATRLEMFLKGELDSYGLEEQDMETYQGSKYTYITEGYSTWFLALNPNFEALTKNEKTAAPILSTANEVDKQMITIKEFRQALSFSLDRQAWITTLDPMGTPAKALYADTIIYDPGQGLSYRGTEEAKDTILSFWGLTDQVGPGLEYETKDDAIASITGYDLAGAKKLFDTAYDKAVAEGYITNTKNFEVQIIIGRPADHNYYNQGYEFLKACWTEAVKGTKLEGHLSFKQSEVLGSSEFGKKLRDNSVDLLFGVGWTGSALDPYYLMQAYVDPNYQYDPSWDTKTTTLDIEINGQVLRTSVYNWGYKILSGIATECTVVVDGQATNKKVKISAGVDAGTALRLKILAELERAVLEQYDVIPVTYQMSASMKSKRVVFGTEDYIYGIGRGGVKYMTYTADDLEWANYVKEQGGTLNYK